MLQWQTSHFYQHLTELGNMSLEIYARSSGKATPASTTPHAALYLLLLFLLATETLTHAPPICFSNLGGPDLQLLRLKRRKLTLDVLPRLDAGDHLAHRLEDLGLVRAHLLRAVALTKRNGAVLDGLEVDGDAEGRAELVVARVALADGRRRVVHPARDTKRTQLLAQLARDGGEVLVAGEGHDEDLCWGDGRREGEDL